MLLLAGEDFADAVEGIDFSDGFVWAETDDTRESEGETAVVAIRTLDIIESDFYDDERFDGADVAVVLDGMGEEIIGQLADFCIGYAGVGFANVDEAIGVAGEIGVADGEGVVGEQA